MRIKFLEIAGFRGVKSQLRIDLPSGFCVLAGRNGTGKSSVCDALEFLLTGSVSKFSLATEKQETIEDYIWWRGPGVAEDKYVAAGFVDDGGKLITVRRGPDRALSGVTPDDLRRLLCSAEEPELSLKDLCTTSIIRDELITQLSVDMAETDRFALVKRAVGGVNFGAAEEKFKKASDGIKSRLAGLAREYDLSRQRVTDLLTEQSKIQAELNRMEDSSKAEEILRRSLPDGPKDTAQLTTQGRTLTAEIRLKVEAGGRLLNKAEAFFSRQTELASPTLLKRIEELRPAISQQMAELAACDTQIADTEAVLRTHGTGDARFLSLAQLHEHGSRLGTTNGHCPLCGSEISEAAYRDEMERLDQMIRGAATTLAEALKVRADLSDRQRKLAASVQALQREADQISVRLKGQETDWEAITREGELLGLKLVQVREEALSQIKLAVETLHNQLLPMERALAVLGGSGALARLANVQKELIESQKRVAEVERNLARHHAVEARIKSGSSTLKRVSAEIVDDRLAAIRPLLEELYIRLKPHVEWEEIAYVIRGDTRRFLSLLVGEGLNPRFIFSSGQRRAAGLAFILAVSLSRPWCKLRSIVLDDPVQHIDDFRALHLVECLAALRQTGKQVICAVEDAALAQLLARRLRSSPEDEGVLFEMGYESGRGAYVAERQEIRPFPESALRSA